MKNSYMGLILATQPNKNIRALTKNRPIASIPFGGRYRIIDFPLTNLTKVGVKNVGIVIPHKNIRSLRDHIRSGQFWDLNRKDGGIFLLQPTIDNAVTKYNVENLKSNLEYLHKSKEKNVIIYSSNLVGNIDLNPIIESHEESGKDVTFVYKKLDSNDRLHLGTKTFTLNSENEYQSSGVLVNSEENAKSFLEITIIEKSLLMDILSGGVQNGYKGDVNKFIELNLGKLTSNFYEHTGYTGFVTSTESFYELSMNLLDRDTRLELLLSNGGISTKIQDTPPALFRKGSKVSNSLVANGCKIKGSIKNSIISRRVIIEEGASIENSVILQSCTIGKGVEIKNVIMDKNVTVGKYEQIIGPKDLPIVIEKKSVYED
ncbi:MAG: glucose-1-phosphate adenylyltransferase subunit GlgD [Psychrilyobacter sp.]|nr:glucose-1-phosphate adenylyltransferase subunit GlgD [Psychrilyobacter sp.]